MNQNQEKKTSSLIIGKTTRKNCVFECSGLHGSEKAYSVSEIYKAHQMPIAVIAPSQKQGEAFREELLFFLSAFLGEKEALERIVCFPPYNILPFKFLSYHNETAANRIRTLYHLLAEPVPQIVIVSPDALLQKLIPKQELTGYAELIISGEEMNRDALVSKLVAGGYTQSLIVEEPGDFCVRGGILDIFSPLYPDPLRIEFFGDTADSLRFFSAASQRKTEIVNEAVILPAKEAILKKENIASVIQRMKEQAYKTDLPVKHVRELTERIKNEGIFPGMESLISLIYPNLDTFFDYVSDRSLFVLTDPIETESAAKSFREQIFESYMSARKEGRLCVEPESLYLEWAEVRNILNMSKLHFDTPDSLQSGTPECKNEIFANMSKLHFDTPDSLQSPDSSENESPFLPFANWLNEKKAAGYTVALVCSSSSSVERLKSLLKTYGILPVFSQGFPDVKAGVGSIYICPGQISSGFIRPDKSLAVITETEIFGKTRAKRKIPPRKVQSDLLNFEDLKKGDLVVHVEHGIGQYEGLVKLCINAASNDFLLILYKDEDKLYLPVDRMSMVQKYMGVEGITPVLDKMGGASWERVKSKVRKSAEKIAGELLKLYAARKVRKGHAYGKRDSLFHDFEAGFPYEETPDQLRAIEDVLEDMESEQPMDRLVCGDVGYGKTEVALRASLLAVNDGKQAAVLVPTTVLAEQHFETFSSRFKDYPITIGCLSRFRSAKEQREIIEEVKHGKIDIVIGTHRLLQKDVEFKDLGLLILDEEQRFGVRHKEALKKMRNTVDVLALTATPIPRTLHLSMTGIRDISVISTPPEHRRAIITYLSEFDDRLIAEAVRKELKRKGQIFFVHNNIQTIHETAAHLLRLTPEVRLDVAHGRMDENALENVMLRFVRKEIDMLVCTTIIESGLDVPSANTIFINRADKFGLAQIYQLRGRVGRGDEQAYAYLFIPHETSLTKDAQKRLKVLMEHSDLGSGFQIALSDLRIRGGGAILGASQSGHIAAVGYDMFLKLMENAVAELKGEPVVENLEPEINVNMSAFFPESYMPDIDQRLSAYRRLAKMTDLKEISDFKAELADRFGELPGEAVNLLLKIMLKALSVKAGVKRLDLTEHQALFYFSEAHQAKPFGIVDVILSDSQQFEFTPDHILKAKLPKNGSPLVHVKKILKDITRCVSA
ncbi:MAG: transcription-repair coupling factor [Desulfobacteraceae bacterium IS3]|nr:MAG: transcription-repair coupling factor [Desulfobacteraceae bacterium IS3]